MLNKVSQLHAEFQTAIPFRHVVIDNFLREEVAEEMLRDFPSVQDPTKLVNEFGVPNPKSAISDISALAPIYSDLDRYIQSSEFLGAMEQITGIPKLCYDPWYYGAGTHENLHGAGLDAHYDFNIHPRTAYHRRLNAIVYLNKNWDPDWKGDIALHTDPWDLKNDVKKSIAPDFNRCVIFETTEKSWHSVTPVDLPPDQSGNSRKSFTIYLYTETRPAEETAPEHGTVYVQGNLPEHIREGRTLTAQDIAEIETNLHRRHEYLRAMYKREYRFSEIIDDLKRQVNEWRSTSYVPVLGLAKIKRVSAPMYHDGWMARELSATIELRGDIRTICASVWLPDGEAPLEMQLSFAGASARKLIVGGVNTISLQPQGRTNQSAELTLTAERVRLAGPHDSREISVIVDSIIFR